ncbi:Xylan 1,4-beta-xylosidase [Paenibacillus algicola]|uniref:Xylan 1,4-beta-xylosidase n=1 Tax=Paenibacillus algicola TaxID=2565926 RepID=A0A4P8XLL5_9BACL|nr:glycoside hydrolase family 43 protein [Paenibacillus algicola]QCT01079.1 Xylan 1,4-beta-xylosidase [Paenibacillus algicola]
MHMITNPILRGFNPDPSILRVEEDYYIATSTFEWFPGVQIHHSRDLVNWRLLTHPLQRREQLNMSGNPNSGGVWAPHLSFDGSLYYLVYTNVRSLTGVYKDTPNYVVTAKHITGPWSDPVYLNSSGFDPSLFHDQDGKKWLVNMVWDHRKGRNPFKGIVLQEYSVQEQRLVGPIQTIFEGTSLGCTEGPHIYRIENYYYLLVAEGGTGYEHAVTLARSRSLTGPYEVDPLNPVLTSSHHESLPLQKAGHGSLVQTSTGEWYMAHLCARPLPGRKQCHLGRETAIQRCHWTDDGWLRVADPQHLPQEKVAGPALPLAPVEKEPALDHFDHPALSPSFSTLREPADPSWLSLEERPGWLRLRGRESLNSWHAQSLTAKRLASFTCEVETRLQFEPKSFQQMAGLIAYYNTKNYYYVHVTREEAAGKCLHLISVVQGQYDELTEPMPLHGTEPVYLKVCFHYDVLQFYASVDGSHWSSIGPALDVGCLSDEAATTFQNGVFTDWGFTGTFVGVCAQDLSGQRLHADFDYFSLKE